MVCPPSGGDPPGGGGYTGGPLPGFGANMVWNVSSFEIPWVQCQCLSLDRNFNLLAYLHQVVFGGNMTAEAFQQKYLTLSRYTTTPRTPRWRTANGTTVRWIDMRAFEELVRRTFDTKPNGFFHNIIPPSNDPIRRYELIIGHQTAILHFGCGWPESVAVIGIRQGPWHLITIDGTGKLRSMCPRTSGMHGQVNRSIYISGI